MAGPPKITQPVGRAIQAAKRAGSSNIDIVRIVLERFGVKIDRRSIDRYVRDNVRDPVTTKAPPIDAGPTDGPIDELQELERSVRQIRTLLRGETSARALSQLNAELRQSLAQIRTVKAEAKGGRASHGPDVSELRQQLMRAFTPTEGERAPTTDVDADQPAVPDVALASGDSRSGS